MAVLGSGARGLSLATGAGYGVAGVITLVDATHTGLKSASRSMLRWANSIGDGKVGRTLAGLTTASTTLMKTTLAMTTALTIGAASVAEFERAIAGIAAITGEGGPVSRNMLKLRERAIELSGDFAFSATEIAQGMRFIAQTGAKTNDILTATGPILQLATATMENFDLAAKLTVRTLNAMGLSIDNLTDVTRVVNSLQFAVNNSVNTLTSLNDALKFSAPFARTLGIELEDLVSVLQLTANAGLEAGIAGRSLGQGLQQLIRSGMRGASDSSKNFAGALQNVINEGGTLADIVRLAETRYGGLTRAQRDQIETLNDLSDAEIKQLEATGELSRTTGVLGDLIQVFGVRGARVFAVLLGQSGKLDQFRTSMELNIVTAAQQAQVALQNLADQAKISINKIRQGIIRSGLAETLLAEFKSLNEDSTLEEIGERIGETLGELAKELVPALRKLVEVLPTILEQMGVLFTTLGRLSAGFLEFTSIAGGALGFLVAFGSIAKIFWGIGTAVRAAGKGVASTAASMGVMGKTGTAATTAVNTELALMIAELQAATIATNQLALAQAGLGKGGLARGQKKLTAFGLTGARSKTETDNFTTPAPITGRTKLGPSTPRRVVAGNVARSFIKGPAIPLIAATIAGEIIRASGGESSESIANGVQTGVVAGFIGSIITPLAAAIGVTVGGPIVAGIAIVAGLAVATNGLLKQNQRLSLSRREAGFATAGDDLVQRLVDKFNESQNTEDSGTIVAEDDDSITVAFGELESQVLRTGGALDSLVGVLSRVADFYLQTAQDFWEPVLTPVAEGANAVKDSFNSFQDRLDNVLFGQEKEILGDEFGNLFGRSVTREELSGLLNERVGDKSLIASIAEQRATKLANETGLSFEEALNQVAAESFVGGLSGLNKSVVNEINGDNLAFDRASVEINGDSLSLRVTTRKQDSKYEKLIEESINPTGGSLITQEKIDALDELFKVAELGEVGLDEFQRKLRESGTVGLGSAFDEMVADLSEFEFEAVLGEMAEDVGRLEANLTDAATAVARTENELEELETGLSGFTKTLSKAEIAMREGLVATIEAQAQFALDNSAQLGLTGAELIAAEKRLAAAKTAQELFALEQQENDFKQLGIKTALASREASIAQEEIEVKKLQLELDKLTLQEAQQAAAAQRLITIALLQSQKAQLESIDSESKALDDITRALANFEPDNDTFRLNQDRRAELEASINDRYETIEGHQQNIADLMAESNALWSNLNSELQNILTSVGITGGLWDEMTNSEREALASQLLLSKQISLAAGRLQNVSANSNTLGDALEQSRDALVNLGFSASQIDETLQTLRELQLKNAMLGFLNNLSELARNTGTDLSVLPGIAKLQDDALALGAEFLTDLINVTGDPQTLAEIFARSTTLTQNVQQTSTISIQAELIFPDNIRPEDRELIAAIAVNALGEAAGDTPYRD